MVYSFKIVNSMMGTFVTNLHSAGFKRFHKIVQFLSTVGLGKKYKT